MKFKEYLDESQSKNHAHGFYGAIRSGERSKNDDMQERSDSADKAFKDAVKYLVKNYNCSAKLATDFLDSTFGRHIGDSVAAGKSFKSVMAEKWAGKSWNSWNAARLPK